MNEKSINNPRAEIDAIDTNILRLLNRRAEIALAVGAAKRTADKSLCDPFREREVLNRLSLENPGPFDEQSIFNIFQRIIDESLLLQQQTLLEIPDFIAESSVETVKLAAHTRIAFLGERGSFSEEAAFAMLGDECSTISFPTLEDLFQAIEKDQADYILTPLENSLVGSIHRAYDLLIKGSLHILAETILPVSHFLIAGPTADFGTIQTVESHPAALAQCERFFAAHPHLTGIAAHDTAGSIQRVVKSNNSTKAAIGGKRTAEIYGGKILRANIEDHAENNTRFALLSARAETVHQGSKISLVVKIKHRPGALHQCLRPFVRRGIDLLKLESCPIKNSPSHFNFYFDLQAPNSENELKGALDEVYQMADDVHFLGRYSTIQKSATSVQKALQIKS